MIAKGIILYLVIVNLFAFMLFGFDKYRAQKAMSRVSENRLLLVALLCGSVGAWSGMYFFRHKTKHLKFVIGVPVIFVVEVIMAFYAMQYFLK